MITEKVPLTFRTNQNEIGLHDFTHFVSNRRTVEGNDHSILNKTYSNPRKKRTI